MYMHVIAPFTVNFSTPTSWSSTRKSMPKHCRMGNVCLMLDLQVRLNEPQDGSQQYSESDPRSGWLARLVLCYCVEAYISILFWISCIWLNFFGLFLQFAHAVYSNHKLDSGKLPACGLLTRLYIKSKSSLYIVLKMLEGCNQASCISSHLSNGLPRLFAEHSLLSTFAKLTQS